MGLRAEAAQMLPDLIDLRRRIHAEPEIGLQLPKTQAAVLQVLDGLGLEITQGAGLSSVVAVLTGDRPGPSVLLRGDMDALPVDEESGEEFASTNGAMHACGHDLHVAGLVGAARLLAARKGELAGNVVFMFQPAEEGPGGALPMIEQGVLDAAPTPVQAAFGMHVSGLFDKGQYLSKPGTAMASANVLEITITGKGGHGSSPWMAVDPVPIAAETVTALQSYVTRRHSVFDPVVITVGKLHAGTAFNIVPATAELSCSVRTLSNETIEQLAVELPLLAQNIAAAHGATAEVNFRRLYPATVNDPQMWGIAREVLAGMFGPASIVDRTEPVMASEDFSYVLQRVPGAFIHVGARPDDVPAHGAPANHSPLVRFDDAVLGDQAAGLAAIAMTALERLGTTETE